MDLALASTHHHHELKVALLAALLLHSLLLVLVPAISPPKPPIAKNLSFTLLTNSQTEVAKPTKSETVVEPIEDVKQPSQNKAQQSSLKTIAIKSDSPALNIEQINIDSWARNDVLDFLQASPSTLDDFDQTFVVPQSVAEPLLQVYADNFGVRHFERTVGNNKVCFQVEGAQPQDEWDFPKLALYHTCQQPKDFEFKMR